MLQQALASAFFAWFQDFLDGFRNLRDGLRISLDVLKVPQDGFWISRDGFRTFWGAFRISQSLQDSLNMASGFFRIASGFLDCFRIYLYGCRIARDSSRIFCPIVSVFLGEASGLFDFSG